jgi:DNA topoisomerase-3
VLWPEYRGHPLSPDDVRHLVQRRVLGRTLDQGGNSEVVLALTDNGHLSEIPVPRGEPRKHRGRRTKPAARGRASRQRNRSREAQPRDRRAAKPASANRLGACPLCGADVVERPKSFSCSGGQGGCRFVIWKSIAGKQISARTAKTLLTRGETSTLKGFKSRAGKPFAARLRLVNGEVKFAFERKT